MPLKHQETRTHNIRDIDRSVRVERITPETRKPLPEAEGADQRLAWQASPSSLTVASCRSSGITPGMLPTSRCSRSLLSSIFDDFSGAAVSTGDNFGNRALTLAHPLFPERWEQRNHFPGSSVERSHGSPGTKESQVGFTGAPGAPLALEVALIQSVLCG